MASSNSIIIHSNRVKQLILEKVKPWLDDFMAEGGTQSYEHIDFAMKFLSQVKTLANIILPKHDSIAHAEDQQAGKFLMKCNHSLHSLSKLTTELYQAHLTKKTIICNEAIRDVCQRTALRVAVDESYACVYDIYRSLKEDRILWDRLFDEDRDSWKKL